MDDDPRLEAILAGDVDEEVVAGLVGESLDDPLRVQRWGRDILALVPGALVASVAHQMVGAAELALERPAAAAAALRTAVDLIEDEPAARSAGTAMAARSAACLSALAPPLMYLGQIDEAEQALARASDRCAPDQRPRIDATHAAVLHVLGRPRRALDLYDRAVSALEAAGDVSAEDRARTNRATLLAQLGRTAAARADYERARQLSEEMGASLSMAMIDHNLGWVAALEGDVVAALAAFDEYDRRASRLGIESAVTMRTRADVLLAAGLAEEARTAAVRAAALFDRQGEVIGGGRARLVAARGALWSGDLATAADLASSAAAELAAQGRLVHAATATSLLAEVEVARGDPGVEPLDPRRSDGITIDLSAAPEGSSVVALDAVTDAADTLADAGLADDHARSRSSAVRLALRAGDHDAARKHAERLAGAGFEDPLRSPIDDAPATLSVRARVLALEARARLAAADGAVATALAHVGTGLDLVDEHRAALGATDLRTGASSLAADLAVLGLALAVEHEPPARVWWWAEQTRAASLRRPPVRPPEDVELRGALARLRDTVASVDRAVAAGDDLTPLVARQQVLETRVTALTRRARDERAVADDELASPEAVAAELGGRVLIELMAIGHRVHGLVVRGTALDPAEATLSTGGGATPTSPAVRGGPRWMAGGPAADVGELTPAAELADATGAEGAAVARDEPDGRSGASGDAPHGGPSSGAREVVVELVDLAGRDEVAALAEQADHALRRLAFSHGSPRVLAAVRAGIEDTAARLDALLLAPLLEATAAPSPTGVVVVPSSALHALPWAVLPSLRDRPVEVAPSATIWVRAARRRAEVAGRAATVVLVAGPDLAHADDEVAALAALHPDVVVLTSDRSTATATLEALEVADVAHLACHGEWRADQPLFSALRLADGPLTVHDLTALDHPPHTILLSACELGRSQARPGEELLGLASSLLGLGAATVVASSVPVADAAVRDLMTDVHRHLAAGTGPAASLHAAASARMDADDQTAWAAAASMLVLGAG